MKVRELMTHAVAAVRADESLNRAARLMKERDCGCVAVVDAESRVVGMLTDRDVCLAALRADSALSTLEARTAMSTVVHTCSPEDSVVEAERRMGQHQVRRLPVVDPQGRLCGILSLEDIAREAWRGARLIAPPLSAETVGTTLGQISRPHLLQGPTP